MCPLDPTVTAAPPPFVLGVNTSYTYVGTGLTTADTTAVLVHCDPKHHGGKVPVAFADGSVRVVQGDELRQLLPDLLPAE